MNIEINGLTEAQELALIDMLAVWKQCSDYGASRWVAFYADGDGNFHPDIFIDGKKPEFCTVTYDNNTVLVNPEDNWKRFTFKDNDNSQDGYFIDFDKIAGALHALKEPEAYGLTKNKKVEEKNGNL